MILSRLAVPAAIVIAAGGLSAQQLPIPSGAVQEGTLSFDGRATAGDFIGSTSTVSGSLTGAPTLGQVHGWVEAPVNTLKTGNDHRDRDLNKSMESEKFPAIRFELDSVGPASGTSDSLAATLYGRLLIHGQVRAASLPSFLSFRAEAVRVRTAFPLNLKDYHIGGLSKMLGILKMHEDIVVHVDVTFGFE
jgi:polyisoprenoid-binding protein YceI